MANLKGSGKGGRPKKYQDPETAKAVAKAQMVKIVEGKKKFNVLLPTPLYDRFIKTEKDNRYKFHADFITQLLDVYDSTEGLRRLVESSKSPNELL